MSKLSLPDKLFYIQITVNKVSTLAIIDTGNLIILLNISFKKSKTILTYLGAATSFMSKQFSKDAELKGNFGNSFLETIMGIGGEKRTAGTLSCRLIV